MAKYLSPRDIDWLILLIVLLICAAGVLQIYSATSATDNTSAWWKQILYIGGGLVLMWLVMAIDYHSMLHYVTGLFIGSLVALGVAVLVIPATYHFLPDYQKRRWVGFMNPEGDPQGKGYQSIQSQIAIGSGGMFGKGVTKGTQTQLRFLPVPWKDFIFAAFAEEHGFVGVIVLMALFFVLLMRIVQNAQTAPDRVGMYICMGVAALLLFHILVNVGMVAGLIPVTGIPLPFMSFGGSSIWTFFIALGLVNNVRLRRFVN